MSLKVYTYRDLLTCEAIKYNGNCGGVRNRMRTQILHLSRINGYPLLVNNTKKECVQIQEIITICKLGSGVVARLYSDKCAHCLSSTIVLFIACIFKSMEKFHNY